MREIMITNGKVALVDDEDYERVVERKWYAAFRKRRWYVHATSNPRISLHGFILGEDRDRQIDHINLDGLDNRRSNLRFCTTSQNCANQSKYRGAYSSSFKGVSLRLPENKWRAIIRFEGKLISLGSFDDEREAAKRYNEAAVAYFREFARLNDLNAA